MRGAGWHGLGGTPLEEPDQQELVYKYPASSTFSGYLGLCTGSLDNIPLIKFRCAPVTLAQHLLPL